MKKMKAKNAAEAKKAEKAKNVTDTLKKGAEDVKAKDVKAKDVKSKDVKGKEKLKEGDEKVSE